MNLIESFTQNHYIPAIEQLTLEAAKLKDELLSVNFSLPRGDKYPEMIAAINNLRNTVETKLTDAIGKNENDLNVIKERLLAKIAEMKQKDETLSQEVNNFGSLLGSVANENAVGTIPNPTTINGINNNDYVNNGNFDFENINPVNPNWHGDPVIDDGPKPNPYPYMDSINNNYLNNINMDSNGHVNTNSHPDFMDSINPHSTTNINIDSDGHLTMK